MTLPTVHFFLPPNDDVYFDAPLVLAEGLKELGVPFHANRDYWRLGPDSSATLFTQARDRTHDDADVVVIHDDWFYHFPQSTLKIERRPAPPGVFKARRNYRLVYLDTWVGAATNSWDPEFRECDLILRTQFNRRCAYPANMKPWVLGFTNRVRAATAGALPFDRRRRTLVENFSYTHPYPHGLRQLFLERIAPRLAPVLPLDRTKSAANPGAMSDQDRLMWEQTVDKHNPDYFARLGSSAMVAAFCGNLCPWLPADAAVHFRGGRKHRLISAIYRGLAAAVPGTPRVIQWDSWRFWEALCAGAVPLHVDLEKYGALLPVMPENWQHYVGVDLDHLDDFVDRISSDFAALGRIAEAGRQWALEHYSPRMMARRFLASLGHEVPADPARPAT